MTGRFDGFRAVILRDTELWATNTVRLMLADPSGALLCEDGTWRRVPEGERVGNAGMLLPAESVAAIADAIRRFQGVGDHEAEAAVLREWLKVEQSRVDRILERKP